MEDNKTLIASAAALLVLSAIVVKMTAQDSKIEKQAEEISMLKFELC